MGKEPEVAMKHMAACASETAAERVTAFGIPKVRACAKMLGTKIVSKGRSVLRITVLQ